MNTDLVTLQKHFEYTQDSYYSLNHFCMFLALHLEINRVDIHCFVGNNGVYNYRQQGVGSMVECININSIYLALI